MTMSGLFSAASRQRLAIQLAAGGRSRCSIAFPAYRRPTPPPRRTPRTAVTDSDSDAAKIDPDKLFGAIVKVSTHSVPDARSAESLGNEREGTGVVIGKDGLVLTIGYLIVEADDVQVTDSKGRVLPATVVGYDHASGFGLVRTLVPLDATPVALGDSAKTSEREPVLIASAGGDGASFAWIVSKRPFTGNWEYRLDYALFTSPPTADWSGAALIDGDGKLLGIGSLIVREATDGDTKLPGNVFVPIDLLKPILADLVRQGHRAGPARPWLGVTADEIAGPSVRHAGIAGRPGRSRGRRRRRHHPRRRRRPRPHAGRVLPARVGAAPRRRRRAAQGAEGRRRQGDQGPLDRPRRVLPPALDDLIARRVSRRRIAETVARRRACPRRRAPANARPRVLRRRPWLPTPHAPFRADDLRKCVPALSRPADHRQADPAVVRRLGRRLDDVPRVLPGGAARRLRVRRRRRAPRRRMRSQALLHVALLVASLVALPIVPGAFWKPARQRKSGRADPRPARRHARPAVFPAVDDQPAAAGVVCATLSRTAIRIACSRCPISRRCWRCSRYPFAIEPWIPTRTQAHRLVGRLCALRRALHRHGVAQSRRAERRATRRCGRSGRADASAATLARAASCGARSPATGSVLLLSVTNHITQNIAAVPLLWIVPLTIYLLTFILCFDSSRWYPRETLLAARRRRARRHGVVRSPIRA